MRKKVDNIIAHDIEEVKLDSSLKAKVNREISKETMDTILASRNTRLLNTMAETYEPYNIASALSSVDQEGLLFFFKSVNPDNSADIFAELDQDQKEEVVKAFTSKELYQLVEELEIDDLVDFVDELPSNLISKVLKATSKEEREQINYILKFEEDSAGRLMNPEFLYVEESLTVKEVIQKIKKEGQDKETVWKTFVVDNTRKLVGTINLDKLLISDEKEIIKDVMDLDVVSVTTSTSALDIVKVFKKYDISILPVTNSQKRVLGLITYDDLIDLVQEQNTDDILHTAQTMSDTTPYLKRSIFNLVKSYAIWLVILLVLDTFIAMVLSNFDQPLHAIPLLVAFLTPLMASNSNAADQTATVIIRELALGNITPKEYFKLSYKELKTAAITGIMLGLFSFTWILFELYTGIVKADISDIAIINNSYFGNKNIFYLSLAGLNGLAAFISVIFAKLLGVSIPLLAKKIKLDPAVMSQPVISTILDIISIIIYFLLAQLIMKGL